MKGCKLKNGSNSNLVLMTQSKLAGAATKNDEAHLNEGPRLAAQRHLESGFSNQNVEEGGSALAEAHIRKASMNARIPSQRELTEVPDLATGVGTLATKQRGSLADEQLRSLARKKSPPKARFRETQTTFRRSKGYGGSLPVERAGRSVSQV